MKRNASFIRKVVYIAIIALLLIPLSYLSQPATTTATTAPGSSESSGSAGGKLARMREEYKLSQAELGEIDPASETMKLATLGLKGVAANMLWHQATEYKKKKMWDRLAVTVRQITKLQPNFETVWEFQAHNLAYNVSMQFDNYEHRYHWVKKGLEFLMEGTKYNTTSHRLFWYTGWIVGQKIGRSDEFKQFRAMFKQETDFRRRLENYVRQQISELPLVLQNEFDNWIMSHLWFVQAEKLESLPRAKPLKMSKPVFYQSSAKALINYAGAISEEVRPELNGITQQAWKIAAGKWRDFGDLRLRTPTDMEIALNQLESTEARLEELRNELDTEIAPGAREEIMAEKRAALADQQPNWLAALEEFEAAESPDSLDEQIFLQASEAKRRLEVTDEEVAARAPDDKQKLAERMLAKIIRARDYAFKITQWRHHANFEYWRLRCQAEGEDDAILARQAVYDARELADRKSFTRVEKLDQDGKVIPVLDESGKPVRDQDGNQVFVMQDGARQKYEQAWKHWWNIFEQDQYHSLIEDVDTDDLMTPIKEYRELLFHLHVEPRALPISFELLPLLTEKRKQSDGVPTAEEVVDAHFDFVQRQLGEAEHLAEQGALKQERVPEKDSSGQVVTDETGEPVYKTKPGARETYEAAFGHFSEMFTNGPPGLIRHPRTEILVAAIPKYREVVKKLGETDIPVNSPLMEFLATRGGESDLPTPEEIRAAHTEKQPPSNEEKPISEIPQ